MYSTVRHRWICPSFSRSRMLFVRFRNYSMKEEHQEKSPAFTGDRPILDQIKEKDKLLSYPYESINPFLICSTKQPTIRCGFYQDDAVSCGQTE